MPHPTWLGKLQWFKKHKYNSYADGAEDQHLLLRAYKTSTYYCIQEPLLAYRENIRPMKKMLRARRVFSRAYLGQFILQGEYQLAATVMCSTMSKMFADFLNLVVGLKAFRNSLKELSPEQERAWKLLWGRYN
jgi:hypothetical protein